MTEYRLVLIGFGNVGRALAQLLRRKETELSNRYGITTRVVAIATGSRGNIIDPEGIDLDHALQTIESGGRLDEIGGQPAPSDSLELIRSVEADVLFENSPVNYDTGQPAVSYLETALEKGMHAITANKGPVVHAYHQLTDRAQQKGKKFLFESTVMDGAPIFGVWRSALPAIRPTSFRGVLNSTTNLILHLMEEGKTYPEAVAYAQEIGIAETDPSGDTQGWDAAVKVAALATVLMDTPLKPQDIEREGIEGISASMIADSLSQGRRWKLVCQAEKENGKVRASVQPTEIGPEDMLYNVIGTTSAITFTSDALGDLTLIEKDPSPHTTAYGLLADFVNAVLSS